MFSILQIPKPKSYSLTASLSDRVKEFNPQEHEVQNQTATHDYFNCPFCIERRGKYDDDAKLAWDRTKLISWCFKCNVIGILHSDQPRDEVLLQLAIKQLVSKLESQRYDYPNLTTLPYEEMFKEIDDEGKNYLLNRVPLYSEIVEELEFRVSPKYGISVPVRIDNKVVGYCIRVYNPAPKAPKYLISNGVKYLYSPTNILSTKETFIEVTLVEGIFDAIGALLDGYINPVACFGKTLTDLQISILRSRLPTKINIYLDEAKLSWKLLNKIKGKFPTCSSFNVIPTNLDPEERLICTLQRINTEEEFNKLLSIINNLKVNKEVTYVTYVT